MNNEELNAEIKREIQEVKEERERLRRERLKEKPWWQRLVLSFIAMLIKNRFNEEDQGRDYE